MRSLERIEDKDFVKSRKQIFQKKCDVFLNLVDLSEHNEISLNNQD